MSQQFVKGKYENNTSWNFIGNSTNRLGFGFNKGSSSSTLRGGVSSMSTPFSFLKFGWFSLSASRCLLLFISSLGNFFDELLTFGFCRVNILVYLFDSQRIEKKKCI